MEDEFQLISKGELTRLKNEISELKKNTAENNLGTNTQNQISQKPNSELISEIIKTIQQEGKKDRELILENLTNLKDINQTTLKNVLERTDKLDTRIGSLVDTISELVGTVKELVLDDTHKSTEESNPGEMIQLLNKIEESGNQNPEVIQKLEEIQEFMNNLKILLGQIKPNDMQKINNF